MSKGLEALKELQTKQLSLNEIYKRFELIEKELKVIEIIRKHFNGLEILTAAMTDKEWKLLKEVLTCKD